MIAECDASAGPGGVAVAAVLHLPGGSTIRRSRYYHGGGSANWGEYQAVLFALDRAEALGLVPVVVRTDHEGTAAKATRGDIARRLAETGSMVEYVPRRAVSLAHNLALATLRLHEGGDRHPAEVVSLYWAWRRRAAEGRA